jgi:putative inorganic carbon (HCO3(-)) transporter
LQYGAILTTLYTAWLQSGFFAFLRKIHVPFKNAYNDLALVKLARRHDSMQDKYDRSLFARIINFLLDLMRRIIAAIANVLRPAFSSSIFVKLCSGSVFLNFEFMLGAFICGMFIAPHSYWSNSYAVLAAFGFLALYLILVGCGKRKLLAPSKLGLPLAIFAITLVLSLLFSFARADSERILLFFITAFVLAYVIAADITEEKQLTKLMAFIYIAVMLTSMYAIIQRKFGLVYASASFTDLLINSNMPGRVTSTLDNPNNYSEFIILFMPLCAAFAGSRKKPWLTVLLFLGLAFPAVGILMTYSRSGWISLMLAAFVYIWLRNKKLIPAFIVLAVLAIPFLPASILNRITSIFTSFFGSGYMDSSASHRLKLWEAVGYMIRDYGVTGIGLGPKAFAAVYPSYSVMGASDGAYHTQSLFLELIVEAGVLGLISFVWMALRNIKNCVIAHRSASGTVYFVLIACAASFIGIAFSCIVEYIWFYPRILFAYFILFGISLAAINMAAEQKS